MKSDLTCPVEVTGAKVEREASSDAVVCKIDFRNLSEKTVDSLQMNVICFDADGERVGGRLVRSAVTGEPQSEFAGDFYPEHVPGAARVEASVEKIWFKDGVVWRREERNVREYKPNALPEGRELDRLRAVAGPDAMGYPREDDSVWMCVCGRANRTSDESCMRCRRERAQVMRDYSFEAIDGSVGEQERKLEQETKDNIRRSSEESARRMETEQKKRKKRGHVLTAIIVLLALGAAGLALWRWGIPAGACLYAQYRYDAGLAADAKAVYTWVDGIWPGFMQAGERANRAEETIIERLILAQTEETLAEAAQRAAALDTENAPALYERALLAHAELCRGQGRLERAETLLQPIAQTEAGSALTRAISYEIAKAAMERVTYPEAIERFGALEDYEDAARLMEECRERYGHQLMRDGKYEEACAQLLLVANREGVIEEIRACRYALAGERMEAGELLSAAELYESLGVYEESAQRAAHCRYTAGMQALAAGELEAAAEQLALAGDYEDARECFEQTARTVGFAALQSGDNAKAVVWLERVERTEEIADALNRANYALAQALETAESLDEAAIAYQALGDYEDAAERAQTMLYKAALRQADPQEALDRFLSLGDYRDSAKRANDCRSELARTSYEAGDYERALAFYEEIGRQGETGAKNCRYALAALAEEEEDFERAAELFAACGAYLDAEERTQRAAYRQAETLEASGSFAEAAKLFGSLGSWENAPKRRAACEDQWLQSAYTGAKMDIELGDYANAIAQLEPFIGVAVPARYNDIQEMYIEANVGRAQKLISAGRPLDALPCLETAARLGSKTAEKLLDAYVYKVIGRWKTQRGMQLVFRRDGTCSIDGQECYYGGKDYDLFVGDEPYPTKKVYSVVGLRNKTLTLKDLEKNATLRLTYLGEPTDAPKEKEE